MKIEVIKLIEEPIREIEDFGFGSLELARIFIRTVKEGDTMKIEVEDFGRRVGIRTAITAKLKRNGINVLSWMTSTHLFFTHCIPDNRLVGEKK